MHQEQVKIEWRTNEVVAEKARLGHSRIILYQGETRLSLDAKECPVGTAFKPPQRFSCACITGIWAFYEDPCNPPIAILGGNSHCFLMPRIPISMAVVVSNPLRGLGDSLTVFEADMKSVRSKIYRNIHMGLENLDHFLTLNSSWTLTSPDGSRSICIDSKPVIFEGMATSEQLKFPGLTYCSFVGVSKEMPYVGGIKKGCNASMALEPLQCQPILPPTGEDVCLDSEVISQFANDGKIDLNPVSANELEDETTTLWRMSRALENLGQFAKSTTTTTSTTTSATPTEKYASAYLGEPSWHRRWAATKNPEYFNKGKAPQGRSMSSSSNTTLPVAATPSVKPWNDFWTQPQLFLMAIPSESNQLVTNHLWMYHRTAIRNALNITRLVPPDEAVISGVAAGKVKNLLTIHTEIMKKICPLIGGSFFDILMGTFVGLLTKGFRWREPYLEQSHYLRILTSLTVCRDNAITMMFMSDKWSCSEKGSDHIILPDKGGEGTVSVKVEIPEVFKSEKFEPVIEAVWKIFLSVHSFCFKDFSDQYQDHHKYTTLMLGLFTNQLHDIWVRNKTIAIEYSNVLGDVSKTMRDLDRCAVGARMNSEYPFHMSRPTKLTKYSESSRRTGAQRVKRSTSLDNRRSGNKDVLRARRKRLAVNSVGDSSADSADRSVMGGQGICLRKYSDSSSTFEKVCNNNRKRE